MAPWILYYSKDDKQRIFRAKDKAKDKNVLSKQSKQYTKVGHICPLTGKSFKQRGKFWDYIKSNKLDVDNMTYDRSLNVGTDDADVDASKDKDDNKDNITKLLDITYIEYLWSNYFELKGDKKLLENLIGQINLELYIILLKVYKGDMDIDKVISGFIEEDVGVNVQGECTEDCGVVLEDSIYDENVTEDNVTEDNSTEDNVTEDNDTEDNDTEDSDNAIVNGIANDGIANDGIEIKKSNIYNLDQKHIKQTIKHTNNYINVIDQKLHNDGINKLNRMNIIKCIIMNIYDDKYINESIKKDTFSYIKELLKEVLVFLPNSEISQQIFMFYGSIILKNSLDQFYTPITITNFLNSIVIQKKKYLDPAAGTGDLLISFTGDINLWEISEEAVDMAKLNYSLNNKTMKVNNVNSLKSDIINEYDYVIMNPPFGTKTVIKDKSILNKYVLGKNRDKQEIGILFVELGLKCFRTCECIFLNDS